LPSTPHSPLPHHSPAAVELIVFDVDGVLTDGSIFLDDNAVETKRFNIRDGFGIRLWQELGFATAIITGRHGRVVQHRVKELGIAHLIQGSADKAEALASLAETTGMGPEKMAYLGDDWPDLPALRRVGYPMAVADAESRVLEAAAYITTKPGGFGAAREAIDHIIRAKGLLDRAQKLYD
jgi:3-deoxy-D-manno-octulosonate 8-phosphate phosphatase (KDO 8-P phosphatase)